VAKHVLFMHAMYAHKLRSFQSAKAAGLTVSVVGPELPGWVTPYVDHFIEAPTDTPDEMRRTIALLRTLHDATPFDGVVTFWDHGVVPAAQVGAALGLPSTSIGAAHRVRNKAAMREALARGGVPHPAFARVTSWEELRAACERIGFPAIYKPTGGAGSAGVLKIESAAQLRSVYEIAANYVNPDSDSFFAYYPNEFVLEEFLSGQEVSVEGVVARGAVHLAGVTEKWVADHSFTEYRHAYPARLSEAERREATQLAEAAVKAIGIDNCGFHVEIMMTADGGRIVEVNGRLGGGFIASHLVPLGDGTDLIGASLRAALGEPVDLAPRFAAGACTRFLVASRAGTVREWIGLDEVRRAPGVQEFGLNKQVGDRVVLPPEAFFESRLAYVVTDGPDTGEAIRRAEAALAGVRCVIA